MLGGEQKKRATKCLPVELRAVELLAVATCSFVFAVRDPAPSGKEGIWRLGSGGLGFFLSFLVAFGHEMAYYLTEQIKRRNKTNKMTKKQKAPWAWVCFLRVRCVGG